MKYNVGDKVRINSLGWYFENADDLGNIDCNGTYFLRQQSDFCGRIMTVINADVINGNEIYGMDEDQNYYFWTDEMIEGLVEEIKPKFKVGDKVILDPYPCKITDVHWRDSLHGFVYTVRGTDFGKTVNEADLVFDERTVPNTNEIIQLIKNDWNNFKDRYDIPDDYHFVDKNGNEVNISDIVLEKKKTKYPKTYEECCKVLNFNSEITGELLFYYPLKCGDYTTMRLPEMEKFEKFIQLYLCRNAYWKIAGEEMGLGKPWEPDYKNPDIDLYVIINIYNQVEKAKYGYGFQHCVLAFPTEEMRDAFYENFKKEIEECKELL